MSSISLHNLENPLGGQNGPVNEDYARLLSDDPQWTTAIIDPELIGAPDGLVFAPLEEAYPGFFTNPQIFLNTFMSLLAGGKIGVRVPRFAMEERHLVMLSSDNPPKERNGTFGRKYEVAHIFVEDFLAEILRETGWGFHRFSPENSTFNLSIKGTGSNVFPYPPRDLNDREKIFGYTAYVPEEVYISMALLETSRTTPVANFWTGVAEISLYPLRRAALGFLPIAKINDSTLAAEDRAHPLATGINQLAMQLDIYCGNTQTIDDGLRELRNINLQDGIGSQTEKLANILKRVALSVGRLERYADLFESFSQMQSYSPNSLILYLLPKLVIIGAEDNWHCANIEAKRGLMHPYLHEQNLWWPSGISDFEGATLGDEEKRNPEKIFRSKSFDNLNFLNEFCKRLSPGLRVNAWEKINAQVLLLNSNLGPLQQEYLTQVAAAFN